MTAAWSKLDNQERCSFPLVVGRYVCLDLDSSFSVRGSLISLITDVERKENIIQDQNKTIADLQ